MMVPRSFKYSSSPQTDTLSRNERRDHDHVKTRHSSPLSHASPRPVAVPKPSSRLSSRTPTSMPLRYSSTTDATTRRSISASHDPNALPPAIAALLAVTAIPPRRHQTNPRRRKSSDTRHLSIDELMKDWKCGDSLRSSLGTSPALSLLLEDQDETEPRHLGTDFDDNDDEDNFLHTRSTSSDSVPSLEADARSLLSGQSPSTPGSLRSRRSISNLRRDKTARSLPIEEVCDANHPLAAISSIAEDVDDFVFTTPRARRTAPKSRASLKSNLTTSLQALRAAALSSISSFSLSSVTAPQQRFSGQPMSDDMLWSHPFLFPRFSTEVRPAFQGIPTEAQRRYLNPIPLTFEEQEAPFQLALHAPYLAEHIEPAPSIQMQTYHRGRRRLAPSSLSSRRGSVDAQSEAGRARDRATADVRQREPRENSDFLRVVVLEMNMRRQGKLDTGRAKIWLPPRQSTPPSSVPPTKGVPRRWTSQTVE